MAHANPEFALGLMRPTHAPVSSERREVPTAGDMRRWIDRILSRHPNHRHGPDAEAAERFIAGAYRIMLGELDQRSQATSVAERGGRDTRPKRGEKFVEPRRRIPLDIQRDKVRGGAW